MIHKNGTLELTNEAMEKYGEKVIEAISTHYQQLNNKKPVAISSREEMDKLFLEEVPEKPSNPFDVLDFVLDNVMTQSTIVAHPKSFSFCIYVAISYY